MRYAATTPDDPTHRKASHRRPEILSRPEKACPGTSNCFGLFACCARDVAEYAIIAAKSAITAKNLFIVVLFRIQFHSLTVILASSILEAFWRNVWLP